MRHKRILDAAADRPDASLEALAAEVPTATVELVERVLEEYGDPAGQESEQDGIPGDQDMAEQPQTNGSSREQHGQQQTTDPPPDGERPALPALDDLSPTQRETLRAIADHPEATQRELAEELGVADATVSNRVNAIEGFAWDERRAIVEELFDDVDEPTDEPESNATERASVESDQLAELTQRIAAVEDALPANGAPNDSESAVPDQVDRLADRIAALEDRIAGLAEDSDGAFGSPALTHKVIHACLESDRITEDEELELLQAILE